MFRVGSAETWLMAARSIDDPPAESGVGRGGSTTALPLRLPIYVVALVNTGQHQTTQRVALALLRPHKSASDNTSRTVPLALSRWRHGFESRWGCESISSTRPSPEGLVAFSIVPPHDLRPVSPGKRDPAGTDTTGGGCGACIGDETGLMEAALLAREVLADSTFRSVPYFRYGLVWTRPAR